MAMRRLSLGDTLLGSVATPKDAIGSYDLPPGLRSSISLALIVSCQLRLSCALDVPLADWSKRSVRCGTLAGMAHCACCRSPNAHFGPPRVPDGLPAKVTVCGICTRHLGNSPADVKRRDQDHFEQWAQDAELLTEDYRDALAKRDEHIEELRATNRAT